MDDNSGALQAIFDGVLVIIGALQWIIYRNMRRDSIAKDRACVFVDRWNYVAFANPNEQTIIGWRFNPVFQNAGNTIAEKTVAYVSGFAGPEITNRFVFPDRGDDRTLTPFIIGPRSITQGGFVEIPVEILIAAQKKMLRVFVWGWIEYRDTFNMSRFHRFEFCNEIIPNFDLRSPACSFGFPYKTSHNGEDDDCLRKPGERGPLEPLEWPDLKIQPGHFDEFGLPEPEERGLFDSHDAEAG